MIPGASIGFFNSNKRPYGEVDPAAAVSQDSSAVINVPQGVQKLASKETWARGAGLCQIVSVRPELRSCRCTPDCPVSNTVKRKRPLCGPVSLTVFMSQLPELGLPIANCVLRSAIER